ncbi:hypothetical protein VB712_15570 [Spirulina sp. CCNP1310]|uniref:hypothetical protein n=1 Tax=Spirulina sp. CCNP1310 TaxID=3110249 RepID=UPI002B203C33|nr:hypothetical protein [Spirulina sp. CCNP1310]MEA5420652.1 hypothetical protein [Spirulina sp. CCNP1310]
MNTQAALIALLISSSFSSATLAETLTQPAPSLTLAAVSATDPNCRQTNRTVDVLSEASVSATSQTLATLAPETKVKITGVGSNGWVPISEPVAGFVIARHLTLCTPIATRPTFTQHPTLTNLTAGMCRQANLELAVRPRPAVGAEPRVGGLNQGMKMTLTGETVMDAESRLWLRISVPFAGWISGGQEGGTNVSLCS